MPLSILKIFTIFGIVSAWAEKALEDGKITLPEAADLGERLGGILGIPTALEIPTAPLNPAALVEEANKDGDTAAAETTVATSEVPPWVEKQPPKPESNSKP